jgi:hypothetical protein
MAKKPPITQHGAKSTMRSSLVLTLLFIPTVCGANSYKQAFSHTSKALGKIYDQELKYVENKINKKLVSRGINPEYVANGILFIDAIMKQKIAGTIRLGKGRTLIPSFDYRAKSGNIQFSMPIR